MVNPSYTSVPFHVRLVCRERIDDRLRHCLEFGVVGATKPAAVIIGSDFYRSPIVEERLDRAGIDLPDQLMDALAIGCFRLLAAYVIDCDGECGTWTSEDVTRWLRRLFSPDDADQIVKALSPHVTRGLVVENCVVVGDDDVVLADNYR